MVRPFLFLFFFVGNCEPLLNRGTSNQGDLRVHVSLKEGGILASDVTDFTLESRNEVQGPWMERAQQLHAYAREHGHCLVPKRYPENPKLGNWVNKQRQEYRKFLEHQPCSLTEERIAILNDLGFCWNAAKTRVNKSGPKFQKLREMETHDWMPRMEQLSKMFEECGFCSVNDLRRDSDLSVWIRKMRKLYNKDSSVFPEKLAEGLQKLDPHWTMTPRQALWERRYLELLAYRTKHGDCCVPISYENKQLANWVSNQRKQYNLKTMSDERLRRLNSAGFVWNLWEHQFAIKDVTF